jgi:hypothetical protein
LRQHNDSLIVSCDIGDKKHETKSKSMLASSDVFQKGNQVFVATTISAEKTAIYIDGKLTGTSAAFPLAGQICSGKPGELGEFDSLCPAHFLQLLSLLRWQMFVNRHQGSTPSSSIPENASPEIRRNTSNPPGSTTLKSKSMQLLPQENGKERSGACRGTQSRLQDS